MGLLGDSLVISWDFKEDFARAKSAFWYYGSFSISCSDIWLKVICVWLFLGVWDTQSRRNFLLVPPWRGLLKIRLSGLLSFALEHPPAALRCCACSGWTLHFLTRCVASHVPYPALHWLQAECYQTLLQVCSLKVHGQVSRENSEDWVVGWFSIEQVKGRSKTCDKRIGWSSGDLEHISRDTSGTNIKGRLGP